MTDLRPTLQDKALAHGKVILGGEHAVVYGCPAIAVSIPRALELRCERSETQQDLLLSVPAWGLERRLGPTPSTSEDRLDQALRAIFASARVAPWGHHIHGKTELPAGAGLGSSAALCVGLAKLALGPQASDQAIFELSMVGESVFHGDPSGIDSHLSVFGGVVRFTRGQKPEPVRLPGPLGLWIISSQTPRQSANLVAGVKARMEALPLLAKPTWALFEAQVQAMQEALLARAFKNLGLIMQMQHQLLAGLGVSTPQLDGLCTCAMQAGALGAKLTGAGGGGCVLLLPPPDADNKDFGSQLEAEMQTQMGKIYPHFPLEIQEQ